MDIARIKKNDVAVWVDLFEDVQVKVRHLPQSEWDRIRKECTATRFDRSTHQQVSEVDQEKFRSGIANAVVLDWKGLEDGGEPYPCTKENIDYLMENVTEFRLLVMDVPLSLQKMLAAEREELRKNSEDTSGQKQITRGCAATSVQTPQT